MPCSAVTTLRTASRNLQRSSATDTTRRVPARQAHRRRSAAHAARTRSRSVASAADRGTPPADEIARGLERRLRVRERARRRRAKASAPAASRPGRAPPAPVEVVQLVQLDLAAGGRRASRSARPGARRRRRAGGRRSTRAVRPVQAVEVGSLPSAASRRRAPRRRPGRAAHARPTDAASTQASRRLRTSPQRLGEVRPLEHGAEVAQATGVRRDEPAQQVLACERVEHGAAAGPARRPRVGRQTAQRGHGTWRTPEPAHQESRTRCAPRPTRRRPWRRQGGRS